jgi:bifunctional non-homologous end joining protein LigD
VEPIIPFEPLSADLIPAGDNWTHQIKWDGVRIQTYHDGTDVALYNRKLNKRTEHFPEIIPVRSYSRAESQILDGEVIALGTDGKPSFSDVMRRDGIRRMERVDKAKEAVPISYMIFDILYYNGKWINHYPLQERMELLAKIIIPAAGIQLVTPYSDGQGLFQVIKENGMEGIVCKKLDSSYVFDGKDDRWRKIKNYGDVIAVIGGFTLRGGFVNAVLLGLFDRAGKLYYIGHTGTGKLTKAQWRELTDVLMPDVVSERPFVNKPERHMDAFWVVPKRTAKIQYSEWRWKEGGALRQPSIQSFIDDMDPRQCLLPSE